MKKFIKELSPYIIIILVVVSLRTFIATPVIVNGDSMIPTLKNNQILLLNKIDYRINDIERFDVVVIKVNKYEIIKRVIGLPGETIEYRDNILYINGHEVENDYNFDTEDFTMKDICKCDTIPHGKYLVLGDNRAVSSDSRIIGFIDEHDIKGKVNISLWPLKKVN